MCLLEMVCAQEYGLEKNLFSAGSVELQSSLSVPHQRLPHEPCSLVSFYVKLLLILCSV